MRIIVARHAGFCFGVQRAIDVALEAVKERGRVYCIGPLIHNRQAVEDLARQGLDVAESLEEVPVGAPVMVRTHGAGPELYEKTRTRGHPLIDATVPSFCGRTRPLKPTSATASRCWSSATGNILRLRELCSTRAGRPP